MTREEFARIIGKYRIEYPADKRFQSKGMMESWYEHFGHLTYVEVYDALNRFVETDTSRFPPTVGQLMQEIRKAYEMDEQSESQAWGEVLMALRDSTYNAEQYFDRFDATTRAAVGSPSVMRQWAALDMAELSVAEAQFRRTYRTAKARAKYQETMALEYHKKSAERISHAATMQGLPDADNRLPWEMRSISAVPQRAGCNKPEESKGEADRQ